MRPYALAEDLKDAKTVQHLAARVDGMLPRALEEGGVGDALRGEGFGHPLHPILTDLPLGCFTSATLLDLFGRGRWADAANLLMGIGVASSAPTILTGLAEWRTAPADERPVMLAHAALNLAATGVYLGGVVFRRRGHQRLATCLSLAGSGIAAAGGYLGGHLAFGRRIGGSRA
jgi:uncharacterized membrane protein